MLWVIADRLTPAQEVDRYTQAIMDLGATVCRRSQPDCPRCPLNRDCRAYAAGNPAAYPTPPPRKPRPVREVQFLLIQNPNGHLLLQQRPESGIWGGLWSLPEVPVGVSDFDSLFPTLTLEPWIGPDPEPLQQGFTHYELRAYLRRFRTAEPANGGMDETPYLWYNPAKPPHIGLPTAIHRLLASLPT